MTYYNFRVSNDNGNSEQEIIINNQFYRQPNVFAVIHSAKGQSDERLETIVSNLHNNIDVKIESKSIATNSRFLIGNAALNGGVGQNDLYNMDVQNINKHEEDLPIVNTLGMLAVQAVKERFAEKKVLDNGETIKVNVEMTTALPASIFDADSERTFRERFMANLHEVKVYVKDLVINVQVQFTFVKVMKEGVPALFSLIEDGNENYRNDAIFDRFKQEYNKDVDGSYFLDKRILHSDIGDGSTELVFTTGYAADPLKSFGEKFGLGQAIEKASGNMAKDLKTDISRQKLAEYIKDKSHRFHKKAMQHMLEPKIEVANRLFTAIDRRLKALAYEIDVIVVYGGASIVLEDVLYDKLKEHVEEYGIELLWIPSEFAVDMNVRGMEIFNKIQLDELVKQSVKA